MTDDAVEWRDIRWQVSYAPLGTHWKTQLPERINAIFDRAQYDALLRSLSR